MKSLFLTLLLVATSFCMVLWAATYPHPIQATPLGRHCGDVGPLPLDDPEFCGCTWGEILFRGEPVIGAALSLAFDGQVITATTELNPLEPFPYFDLTAHDLGARRGDAFTLTAVYAGQTISQTFRAWPGSDGEQFVTLTFPETGVWEPLVTGGYTRTLAIEGNTLWAGGPAGLLSVDLTNGANQPHSLPWEETAVRALAITPNNHLWAASSAAVAEWDGDGWQTHSLPFTATLRALVADPNSNTVWVGGGDEAGQVAVFNGNWQMAGEFANAPVTTLAVDSAGRIWVGTWGRGVYRQDGNGGWLNYRTTNGLPSDNVLSLAADANTIWAGTSPYLSGQGPRGGIGRYTLSTDQWRLYGLAEGLPADAGFPQAPADVYGLAVGNDHVWAVTAQGLYVGLGERWWEHTPLYGLPSETGRAVAAVGETTVVALTDTLYTLTPAEMVGEQPFANITDQTSMQLAPGQSLILQGTGQDNDEGEQRLVAWEWRVENCRLLCVQAVCTLPYEFVQLSPGDHTLSYRVQDDEGIWSEVVVQEIVVEDTVVYLPFVRK